MDQLNATCWNLEGLDDRKVEARGLRLDAAHIHTKRHFFLILLMMMAFPVANAKTCMHAAAGRSFALESLVLWHKHGHPVLREDTGRPVWTCPHQKEDFMRLRGGADNPAKPKEGEAAGDGDGMVDDFEEEEEEEEEDGTQWVKIKVQNQCFGKNEFMEILVDPEMLVRDFKADLFRNYTSSRVCDPEQMELWCKGREMLGMSSDQLSDYGIGTLIWGEQGMGAAVIIKQKYIFTAQGDGSQRGEEPLTPEAIHAMVQSPMFQHLVNNPQLLQQLIQTNPQFQQLLASSPELRKLLEDPVALRKAMQGDVYGDEYNEEGFMVNAQEKAPSGPTIEDTQSRIRRIAGLDGEELKLEMRGLSDEEKAAVERVRQRLFREQRGWDKERFKAHLAGNKTLATEYATLYRRFGSVENIRGNISASESLTAESSNLAEVLSCAHIPPKAPASAAGTASISSSFLQDALRMALDEEESASDAAPARAPLVLPSASAAQRQPHRLPETRPSSERPPEIDQRSIADVEQLHPIEVQSESTIPDTSGAAAPAAQADGTVVLTMGQLAQLARDPAFLDRVVQQSVDNMANTDNPALARLAKDIILQLMQDPSSVEEVLPVVLDMLAGRGGSTTDHLQKLAGFPGVANILSAAHNLPGLEGVDDGVVGANGGDDAAQQSAVTGVQVLPPPPHEIGYEITSPEPGREPEKHVDRRRTEKRGKARVDEEILANAGSLGLDVSVQMSTRAKGTELIKSGDAAMRQGDVERAAKDWEMASNLLASEDGETPTVVKLRKLAQAAAAKYAKQEEERKAKEDAAKRQAHEGEDVHMVDDDDEHRRILLELLETPPPPCPPNVTLKPMEMWWPNPPTSRVTDEEWDQLTTCYMWVKSKIRSIKLAHSIEALCIEKNMTVHPFVAMSLPLNISYYEECLRTLELPYDEMAQEMADLQSSEEEGGEDAQEQSSALGGSAQAAAPPLSPEEKYKEQLQRLEEMGFTDAQANLRALIDTGGSIEGAIAKLVG